MFVARLDERTIISVARNSIVAVFPRCATVGPSVSSRPIEKGEPSTRLLNSFFTGSSSAELERPRVHAPEHLEEDGRLHRGGGMHDQRGIPGKATGPLERSLNQMPKRRPAARPRFMSRVRCEAAHLRVRSASAPLLLRRNPPDSPGVAEEGLQERAVERRDLDARDVVARGLQDGPVPDPHRLVVDLVRRPEEEQGRRDEERRRARRRAAGPGTPARSCSASG